MRDAAERNGADLDRVVAERLAAAGPFDAAQFDPAVLRDALALVSRWRSTLLADAAKPPLPAPPDVRR